MKTLVIVESPTKAKAIQNYLGNSYEVIASKGHIRDLSTKGKGGYGVDITNGFEAKYEVIPNKYATVKQIKEKAKNKKVILATDPDREGESIAWHIAQVLELNPNEKNRVSFNEVTKKAVLEAMEHPKPIDMDLVSSQEARRILDRIMGFDLSKVVQRKIGSSSAGRVQSVALKIIVDREVEIEKFVPETYFLIYAEFDTFKAAHKHNAKRKIKTKEEALKIVKGTTNDFVVKEITTNEQKRYPAFPFTTSKLQQAAIPILRTNASGVNSVAQKLYEGIMIDGELMGLITYIRTDSTKLSSGFIHQTQDYIQATFGQDYVGKPRASKKSKSAQEAHEAIRPTNIELTPEAVKPFLENKEYLLYKLIYNRTLAYLMKEGLDEVKTVTFDSNGHHFIKTFRVPLFDGYRKTYFDDEEEYDTFNGSQGDLLTAKKVYDEEHQTEPPKRFSESSLIQEMEKLGIGRPSTYAETTKKISSVGYVKKEKGYFKPTELGTLTSTSLNEYFDGFINTDYTSQMEEDLDLIASGQKDKAIELNGFYNRFKPLIETANKEMPKVYQKKVAEEVGEACPECGKPLVYRHNRKGEKFIACSGFSSKPSCKYTRSL